MTERGLVLVVEDERPIADLLRLYLTRDGFGVHVEHDGTAGLAAARRLRPVACCWTSRCPGCTAPSCAGGCGSPATGRRCCS